MNISRAEITHFPKKRLLKLRDKLVDLTSPRIMGIVNVTPDSFFEESRVISREQLIQKVESMLKDGADLIDVGCYSTRPGSKNISQKEELSRLLPAIELIRKHFPECYLSVDTFRSAVAKAAISEGTDIINDIGGSTLDPKMIDVIAENNTPYILMHGVESLNKMHKPQEKKELFRDVCFFFSEKLTQLERSGVTEVILDPGFGFGKTLEQNYELIHRLELFHLIERPLLMGISRKSMIYKKIDATAEEAINGTTCLNTVGLMKGVSIFRVHDVKQMKENITLLSQ
jgi:dihydropteroate synthase